MSIKSWLRNWLLEPTTEEPSLSLDEVVGSYEDSLVTLEEKVEAAALLDALTRRDKVATALIKGTVTPTIVQRLADLDNRLLRRVVPPLHDADWATWRQSLNPPPDRWWWRLDEIHARAEEKHDLIWTLLASVMMTITLSLAVEIIQRMWGGGPDFPSTGSAILALILTGSPLTKLGRELAGRLMEKVRLPSRSRGETMLGMAVLAFLLTLGLLRALPTLAVCFNNRGYALLRAGDLTGAQRAFARAIRINPDYAAGYYNLADAYVEIGDYDQAQSLYNQALGADRTLDFAYNGLGYVLILQGKPESAIPVLYTGLSLVQNDEVRIALQTNVGRAYLDDGRFYEAEVALAEALLLSPEAAAAHGTLALTVEALEYPKDKLKKYWERCQGFAIGDTPRERELAAMAYARLHALSEEDR